MLLPTLFAIVKRSVLRGLDVHRIATSARVGTAHSFPRIREGRLKPTGMPFFLPLKIVETFSANIFLCFLECLGAGQPFRPQNLLNRRGRRRGRGGFGRGPFF